MTSTRERKYPTSTIYIHLLTVPVSQYFLSKAQEFFRRRLAKVWVAAWIDARIDALWVGVVGRDAEVKILNPPPQQ
jgi:hypothetical protein